VDRDLETIALKCLEKDPERRYGSAEALAEDLNRWLEGEPILARPIGSAERVVKWAKRRPAIAALAVGIATVTVLGIAGVIWQWREAVFQRGQTASALIQVAQEAKAAEAARDQEAAQRAAAESARQQETVARTAADEQKAIAVGALASAQRSNYFNDISLADFEWASNNIPHVDQLLAAAPASMRGWEWHYLNRLAHMETSFVAVGPKLTAMAIDEPRAEAVAITSDLKATRVDLRAHRAVRTVALEGAVGTDISQMSLSADGSRFSAVIIQIDHGRIQSSTTVWDTATGRVLMRQAGQGLVFYSAVALTPDGKRLFTAMMTASDGANEPTAAAIAGLAPGISARTRIQVWDTSTGAELPSPGFADGRSSSFSFSPDGRSVAVASLALPAAVDVKVLDAASLKTLGVLTQSGDAVSVFSADGRRVARGSAAGVGVWSATGGEPQWSWKGAATSVVAFSPSGRYLAAGARRTDRFRSLMRPRARPGCDCSAIRPPWRDFDSSDRTRDSPRPTRTVSACLRSRSPRRHWSSTVHPRSSRLRASRPTGDDSWRSCGARCRAGILKPAGYSTDRHRCRARRPRLRHRSPRPRWPSRSRPPLVN
jgi:WD40 repeat protein